MNPEPESVRLAGSRRSLFGFFLCGVLLSVLGAILPTWGHHLTGDFDLIGHHFLALSIGIITSLFCARRVIARWGVRTTLIGGCCGAFGSLIFLALVGPPAAVGWRIGAFFGIGLSAGLVNWAVFQAISGLFRRHPAAIVNIAGAAFVFGCLTTTLLVSGMFYAYTPGSILVFIALIPGFLAIIFARTSFAPIGAEPGPEWRQVASQFTNPSALLFSLLLFFQFGNEWAVASWLTLFLIQRLGVNPATSLLVLALYWVSLLAGRVVAQWVLPRVNQWKVLISSGAGALFGCLVLVLTNNLFGATMGVIVLGFSFAAILPLVVGRVRGRFPTYHPGVFASVFSFALLGSTLAPAHLGYMARWLGIGVVMALPALGTFAVLLLSVLIWVEARWGAGSRSEARPE